MYQIHVGLVWKVLANMKIQFLSSFCMLKSKCNSILFSIVYHNAIIIIVLLCFLWIRTHLFVYELINFLQWPSVHIFRKWFKFLWQNITILHSCFCTRMKSIFAYQLYVTIFIFNFRFLCVGNYLLFGNCNKNEKNKMENKQLNRNLKQRFLL